VSFSVGTDSPVSADSSTRRFTASIEPKVRGHAVARAQAHEVSGHEIIGLDLDPFAVAARVRVKREHLADALERLFRLAFLDEADDRVDHHHRENDPGVDPVSERRRDDGRRDEDVDEQVVEVLEEPLQQPFLWRSRQAVVAHGLEASGRLVGAQAIDTAIQRLQDLVGRQRVWGLNAEEGVRRLAHDLSFRVSAPVRPAASCRTNSRA
jgi:hypothetical protein